MLTFAGAAGDTGSMSHARRTLRGRQIFQREGPPVSVNRHTLHADYLAPHDHDYLELALITGGTGTHRTIHGDRPLEAGDVVVLQPGAWHTYLGCRGLEVVNCCFGESLLRQELRFLAAHPALGGLLLAGTSDGVMTVRLSPDARTDAATVLDRMLPLPARPTGPARDVALLGLLLQFLAQVAEAAPAGRGAADPEPIHPAVVEAVQRIGADLRRGWTLGELASRAGLERSYFVRLFKAHTGVSPMAYLTRLRLDRAATRLLQADQPVGDIASQVGFDDANYFARRFRHRFGTSATSYRRRWRGQTPARRG